MAFFSTYKLYKQGTSQVVAWLGRTAAQFGYELGSANTSKQEKETEKKGSKSNGKSSSNADGKVTNYMIPVKDLPSLARVISEHVQKLDDSKALTSILEVLKDVIVKRKQWARAFGQPVASVLASKMRHKHFVTVLEEVYTILAGVASTLKPEDGQTSVVDGTHGKSTWMDEVALSNLFYVLSIEEPADQEETRDEGKPVPGLPRSPSCSQTPPKPKYELEDNITDEEVYFMIYCFFADFQAVRHHIGQSWSDYKNGSIDLVAVAVTTNVALEMLQRAEATLIASLPPKYNMTTFERVGVYLQLVVANARGVDPAFRHQRGDVINMDLKDIADFVCLPVYMMLSSFARILQENCIPELTPGQFGKLDMTGQRLSWRDKFQQDKSVLGEILPEFCVLNLVKSGIPAVDKLSLGVMEMVTTKEVPIWLVLGCQIYLDIHHTMLSSIGMAHRELQTMGLHVSKTLENYFNFAKGMSIETWSGRDDDVTRLIKSEADSWVNEDFLAKFQKKLKSGNLPAGLIARPYSLFSRHPLLCGVLLFRLNLRLQEAGTRLVSTWGSLPSIMHLYNAVKQEEFPEGVFQVWEDVENIIQIQGKERVFLGDFPKSPMEYFERFSLVMGYSASIFAQNRRQGQHTPQTQTPASSRGPREMITTSAISDVFRGQYCEKETRSEVSFHKLEKLLSTSLLGVRFGVGTKHKPHHFTTLTFLSALQTHIQADILALNMNYVSLHIRCYDLLRTIQVRLDPEFHRYTGPEYVVKENELPFLVGILFGIAAGSRMVGDILKLSERDGVMVKNQMLKKAGELVKELVQKEGSWETERVRSISHGFN